MIKKAAKLFQLELKDRFPELSGDIPKHISAACVADPRQKGVDLCEKELEEAKTIIAARLESLMTKEGLNPLRANEDISSDEDDMYSR